MDMNGPWGWSNLDAQTLLAIRQFLANLETMEWNALLHQNRAHTIAREKLSADARRRLEELRQDDIDDLISLRKTGRERIWGIKDRDVLKLLWWDPEHTVYPIELQNS